MFHPDIETDYRGSNLNYQNDPAAERLYWIGRFVQRFANTESIMHLSLRVMSRLPDKVARALFGTMSTSDVVSCVIRLQEATNAAPPELIPTLKHFRLITDFRHRTVHRPIGATEDGLRSDNVVTALSQDKAQIMNFKLDDIQAATADLYRIDLRMLLMMMESLRGIVLQKDQTDAFGTWLYKPVQPDNPSPGYS